MPELARNKSSHHNSEKSLRAQARLFPKALKKESRKTLLAQPKDNSWGSPLVLQSKNLRLKTKVRDIEGGGSETIGERYPRHMDT